MEVKPRSYEVPFSLNDVRFTPVGSPEAYLPDRALWNLKAITHLLGTAREEIRIQVLSYSPIHNKDEYWPDLDNALRSAAARGVKVRLLVSDWCKRPPKIDHLKSLSLVPGIEVRLITIPPYSGGFIPFARVSHAKYMIVDRDRSWIGTSNWQKDYFYRSRNVGLVVESSRVASTLGGIFEKDWTSRYAYAIDPAEEYVPPRVD
jgi:phosphatidylserine/phosphatidylglycerophosphate/cardiolipin synthase-like enzyme